MTRRLAIDVHAAAMKRLQFVFENFDNVYVAFSGGKDSGVLLNLALDYIRLHAPDRRIGVYHLDYEAQYTATTEYVDAVYDELGDTVENLRCCVPVKCPTCTSMFETHWRPWYPAKRDIWVRELPEKHLGLEDLPWITPEMSDYEFQEEFARQYHKQAGAKRTAVLVGIRAQESLDRWRTIVSDRNKVGKFRGTRWTTKVGDDVYNAYPIYDWTTEDIWTANARFGWRYNRLYDLMHYAGLPLHAMRVSSPFHGYAKASLALYRTLDPQVWGRMVSRVNGVNFTALYGDTKAMGWKRIEKPAHFTWQQYAEFLLSTLPQEIADNYRAKLAVSIKSWRKGGGVMDDRNIAELRAEGAEFEVGEKGARSQTKLPVTMEYVDDTDVTDFTRIPSWKRFCITILKNDHVGKYMGFSLTKREMDLRQAAIEKYKDL